MSNTGIVTAADVTRTHSGANLNVPDAKTVLLLVRNLGNLPPELGEFNGTDKPQSKKQFFKAVIDHVRSTVPSLKNGTPNACLLYYARFLLKAPKG